MPEREEEEEEDEDPNNSGQHVNDAMNQPDLLGRVLVNVGHPPDEPDIFLAPQIARTVKPHQVCILYSIYIRFVPVYKRLRGSRNLSTSAAPIEVTDPFSHQGKGGQVTMKAGKQSRVQSDRAVVEFFSNNMGNRIE